MEEIHSLEMEVLPCGLNLHYDSNFKYPRIRNWSLTQAAEDLVQRWEKKEKIPDPPKIEKLPTWSYIAATVKQVLEKQGHGPGSRILFLDNIFGPCPIELKPREAEPVFDGLAECRKTRTDIDWDSLLAEQERQINSHKCPPD